MKYLPLILGAVAYTILSFVYKGATSADFGIFEVPTDVFKLVASGGVGSLGLLNFSKFKLPSKGIDRLEQLSNLMAIEISLPESAQTACQILRKEILKAIKEPK